MIGQARLIVMPFDRFGTIAAVDPQPDAVGMAAAGGRRRRRPRSPSALLAAVPLLRRSGADEPFLVAERGLPARRRRGT